MQNKKLNIHRFRTPKNHYVYDVNRGEIIKVDKLAYDVLDLYGEISDAEIINHLKHLYSISKLKHCLTTIRSYQKTQGIFLDFYPEKIMSPFTLKELRDKLENKIRHLILNVTESCNFRCRYCIYSGMYPFSRNHNNRNMSFEIAKKAVDFFVSRTEQADAHSIGFYGGEPLLNYKLIKQIVEYSKEKRDDLRFSLTTNGSLIDREKFEFFVENRFNLLISFDGPPENQNRNRVFKNGKGTFDVVWEKLKWIRTSEPEYFDSCVGLGVTFDGLSSLLEVADFFKEKELLTDLKRLQISNVNSNDTNYYQDKKFDMNDAQLIKAE